MREVMYLRDPRVLLLKKLHAAVEVRALIRSDLSRNSRAERRLFQLRRHRFLRRMLHQRQADEMQIALPQRPVPERDVRQRAAREHQQLARTNLHRVIDQPHPVAARQWADQRITAQPQQP